ncbi:MAG: hypothetical protein ABI210_11015 [Abditibacteriaceae bacterium]
MLKKLLTDRELLPIDRLDDGSSCGKRQWPIRRQELLKNLQRNLYGWTPTEPRQVSGRVVWEDSLSYAGKALHQRIEIQITTRGGTYTLPFHLLTPNAVSHPPVMLNLAFRPILTAMKTPTDYAEISDSYIPAEEILDNGFALAVVGYRDISDDSLDGNYLQGLGNCFFRSNERTAETWGRIGLWAYGGSCVLDYLMQQESLDRDCISVIGHSRLGKTALWMGAQDERLFAAVSNNSGFGGAAVAKHGSGERIADFLRCESCDWFCENFKSYVGREDEQPYDQHLLLAAMAPRRVYVASAEEDPGADPQSEFLSCVAASRAYEILGERGLVTPDSLPVPGTTLHEGRIGYHLRAGRHFLSREDWGLCLRFLRKEREETSSLLKSWKK